jgi:RNA polymerase subunit RPABC4/transcription elongation factor Spt4
MKKLILGIIFVLVMLVPFIGKVASTADSAQDWLVGIAILVVVLAFGCWLVARPDRSETASGPVASVVSQSPVRGTHAVRSEGVAVSGAAVCLACGTASTGSKFCPECGKPLKPRNACSQCGAQYQSGAKFCPECGTKTG